MHLRSRAGLIALVLAAGAFAGNPDRPQNREPAFFYHVPGGDPGSWPAVLSAVGLLPGSPDDAHVIVLRDATAASASHWRTKVLDGAFIVLEGESGLASKLGFRPGPGRATVRNVLEKRTPDLRIIWQEQLDLPVFELPPNATLFAEDRRTGAPLVAGRRHGAGAILWVAASPGEQGHERFPYLLHALHDLGFEPPFRSRRLWAFFDTAYRSRVDLPYFAARWRRSGIDALHVAAWHYFEPDSERDAYLEQLIRECHRHSISVYAWLELPHVSERFWAVHPEWREQTAALQDAHLDWRKLMDLTNPECSQAVAAGVERLLARFDWDGVNLAELYFESLEGVANPARFTPMNTTVRALFQSTHGFDPIELFHGASGPDEGRLREFLDFRSGLAKQLQEDWIIEIEKARKRQPHLDLVLTHVDDQVDPRMRDLIGADSSRTLPLLEKYDFTFLVEDPATVWNLGPERYPKIASRYIPLTSRPEKLAIDINIVERYQDVYPTKQQTGIELLRQIHLSALAFPRVALYAEHSLLRADLPLIPSAAAGVDRFEFLDGKLIVGAKHDVGLHWEGPALVDGRPWPLLDDRTVWLPAGTHTLEPAGAAAPLRLLDFNGQIKFAETVPNGLEIAYQSSGRAYATLDAQPARVEVDGVVESLSAVEDGNRFLLTLPKGQHVVRVSVSGGLAQR